MGLETILLSFIACNNYNYTLKKEEPAQPTDTQENIYPEIEESCSYTDYFRIQHQCTDIIAVVDTSGSMYDSVGDEITRVEGFLTYFTEQKRAGYPETMMMVITAATEITEYTNSPITASETVRWNLEQAEGTREKPLEALTKYVESEHASWIREECAMYFLLFSDEDDQSYTYSSDTEGDNAAVDQFLNDLRNTMPGYETKEMYFTAAVNPSEEHICDLTVEENQIGYRAEQLAAYYSGNINDICSSYDTWNVATITAQEYEGWQLNHIPEPSTITVYIDGQLATVACTYEEGSVTYPYEESLENGTEIAISYEIDKHQHNDECPL